MTQSIHQLFENQLLQWPDLTAIEFKGQSISYLELNQRANQLAYEIHQIAPESDIIGISTTRSIEMIVGMLAILKAGKAYLPLNPTYPSARLSELIDHADLQYVICELAESILFETLGLHALVHESIKNEYDTNRDYPFQEERAYVLYTSGSTGKPKGVCMGHHALLNLIQWQATNSPAGIGTRTLQFAPLTFDASFEDTFSTLITGGTLVLIEEQWLIEPEKLLRFIDDQKINRIFLPFVALQFLTDTAIAQNIYPQGLQYVMTAGEQLKVTPQLVHFFSKLPSPILYNQYGPTETHVCTSLKLDGNPQNWPSLPSIGKPLPNTQIYLLNHDLKEVATGDVGELYVAGICLAKGYLNNPSMTNEKFVTWKNEVGRDIRLYQTGDLARWLPDGNIEFLGRKDDQVKIAGHRIEPGELELVLTQQKGISQAVVVAQDNGLGQKGLVAYLVADAPYQNATALRSNLQKLLPAFMIPGRFVFLNALPKTSSGKVDRKALNIQDRSRPDLSNLYKAAQSSLEKKLVSVWCQLLQWDTIGIQDNFFELGGNSLLAINVIASLKSIHQIVLPITALYQYPTVEGICRFLQDELNFEPTIQAIPSNEADGALEEIAIIAMAGRFPGANTIEDYWNILREGKETIRFFNANELDPAIPDHLKSDPDYVPARGVLEEAEYFDASFFQIQPKQAALTDPQQRLFLELSWEVLEKSGYLPTHYSGRIGVFGGTGNNTYYQNNILSNKQLMDQAGAFQVMTYNEKDYIASRTAFALDLKGPAVSVHAACATSLLAIAQAAASIRGGQCEMAIAGAVSVTSPIYSGHLYQEGGIFSKDGHTRTFDSNATGTVFSDGAGLILLKPKSAAERDGDTIYALIKGEGVNNDGAGKGVFTAPSSSGQAQAIQMALRQAGVHPSQISYIEAHGTATPLGDPIELEGLNQAFGKMPHKQGIAIGSVKSNIGHLTAASGVAGLIKTALALHYKQLPASINCSNPNIFFDFANSPFYVNTQLKSWDHPIERLAGVSSFGIGGTNVHMILGSYENKVTEPSISKPWQLVGISAKSVASLEGYCQKLTDWITKNTSVGLADIAYQLQVSKGLFHHRRIYIAKDTSDLLMQLRSNQPILEQQVFKHQNQMAFLFPGQGTQFAEMGKELYKTELVFKEAVDRCAAILLDYLDLDIRSVLYPGHHEENVELIHLTQYAQPAIFVVEYALAQLWQSWGIQPTHLLGHSIGEYVAAHIAGVFSLDDALMLIAHRGRLMSELPNGHMLAVKAERGQVVKYLPPDCSLAAVNGPKSIVVAGPVESIHALMLELNHLEIPHSLLQTSHAFHSKMMLPMLDDFTKLLDQIHFHEPSLSIVSSVDGKMVDAKQICQSNYWVKQISDTVEFSAAIETLLDAGIELAIEAGPGNVTSKLLMQHRNGRNCFCSNGLDIQKVKSDRFVLLAGLGQIWMRGYQPNWNQVFDFSQRIKIGLPTYAFDKKRSWVDPVVFNEFSNASTFNLDNVAVASIQSTDDAGNKLLFAQVKTLLEEASGLDLSTAQESDSLIELGFDSLLLTQVAINLKKFFGVPIGFRQLNEELHSLKSLIDYIAGQQVPSEIGASEQVSKNAFFDALSKEELTELQKPFGAAAIIEKQPPSQLSDHQEKFLQQLIESYTRKTQGSKTYTGFYREVMADPRVVSGFKPLTKEMVYPIVVKKSKGARLWDVDGNEYIDALNGFGSNLFGYQPDFITNSLIRQIESGFEVGPQHQLAGEVCRLIGQCTGFERTALCNTGSEAVLGAMRIARTVTGRSLIVAFSGSYHGIVDEVIVRRASNGNSYPAAAGIMSEALQNMLILEYGTEESLRIIEARCHELAAVLVEPVQSRRLEFQPVSFLKALRKITAKEGTAFIFDEVITGFRVHLAGAQGLFGIQADLGTYGKVIAGGLPIGVISGKREWMDALDGGVWQYGDNSVPQKGVTYFAGTFVRHPLALATTKASLDYLMQQGPALQMGLTEKTNRLANALNQICRSKQIPISISHFGSVWKLKYKEPIPYGELLFTIMRENGIHIWDGFPCFITQAHSDSDIDSIISVFDLALSQMITAGFILPDDQTSDLEMENDQWEYSPIPGGVLVRDEEGNPKWKTGEEQIENIYDGPTIESIIPVTEAQKEIWLSCFIGGDDANRAYNESISLRLQGSLNIAAIKEALGALINRHEALRSAFSPEGKLMFVFKEFNVLIKEQDLTQLTSQRQEDAIADFLKIEARKSFDLLNGPLFRIALFQLGESSCYVTLTVHHIIADGWSLGVLLQDFGRIYSDKVSKGVAILEKPLGFKEFAYKQRLFQASDAYLQTENYWLERFKDEIPAVNLHTDFQRPLIRSFQSHRNDYLLRQDLVRSFKKIGAGAGSSFVTSLLCAFEVFIQKISKQDQIIIGLPSAGQPVFDMPELVGHCVNLLPIRSQYLPESGFIDYLKCRKKYILDDLDHQQLTFGSLLRKLPISRDASLVPMIPVVFNIDHGMDKGVCFEGLNHSLIYNPRAFENFELFLNVNGTEEQLVLEWSYNTRLFKSSTIDKMMADFEQLLFQITNAPDLPLGDISMGQKRDLKTHLSKRNPAPTAYPQEKTWLHLFEERVAAVPQKNALEQDGKGFTYQWVLEKSHQLAGYLTALGIKENDLVAVAMDRSEKMILTLLAIHRIGAAYLPIDANYPIGRIRFMLEDASVRWSIVSDAFKTQFIDERGVIWVDAIWEQMDVFPKNDFPIIAKSNSLAYVIYTSGSTGNPKGVAVEHKSLVNLFTGLIEEPGIQSSDRFLAITTIAFDISVMELFLPLMAGATLVLADSIASKDGRILLEQMQSNQITMMFATPASWLMILEAGWKDPLPIVALSGGEALPADLADKLLLRCKALWNLYGPTETTILSTKKHIKETNALVTIGKPINNTQIYILNEKLELLDEGVIGEIHIAGDGLARGYLNNDALTLERFIPNPFENNTGLRMYKTGDLGMYLATGEILYMGRLDNQVKIRGLRIELSEIEFQLRKLSGIRDAVVVCREGLVLAYIVPEQLEQGEQKALQWKQDLKQVLPGYMIPSHLIFIEQMPLTANGKVDRNALPIFIDNHSNRYLAPRSTMENIIAAIWSSILGKQKVGIRDDFFELGGHSNLAVLAMIRLEKETGIRLPVAAIFQSPTIEELAKMALDKGQVQILGVADNASIVPLKPFGNKPPLMIVHGFNMSVLMFMPVARQLDHMQPVYGVQPKGLHDFDAPLMSIEEIAKEYIDEMLEKVPSDAYALAGYSFGGFVAFEMARQLKAMGKRVSMLAMFDCNAETGYFRETTMQKLARKSYRQLPKFNFILKSFIRNPKDTLEYQWFYLKNKWREMFGVISEQGPVTKEAAVLDIRYEHALKQYDLKLAAHDIDLFRVKKRLYFVPDQEFLGWRQNTMREVFVHEVPGDHKTFLISPNHIEFAKVLQSVLKRRQGNN